MKYAGEYGVECLIENVPNPTPYLLVTLDDFRLFDEEMEPPINYVLDVAHAHLQGEEFRFIEEFGHKIKHVHISDNLGEQDDHLSLGEGNIDWRRITNSLKEIDFEGWLVLECYDQIEKNIDYLKNLL